MITRDRDQLVGGAPTDAMLRSVIKEFKGGQERRDLLSRYFNRYHAIMDRSRMTGLPNNKLVHDYPGYIVAMATGYLVGSAVQYSTDPVEREEQAAAGKPGGEGAAAGEKKPAKKAKDPTQDAALQAIQDIYKRDSMDSVDLEVAGDASVYGVGVEICYHGRDSLPHAKKLDRSQAFVVYDATVEQEPLFGVYWLAKTRENGEPNGVRAWVYTATQQLYFEGVDIDTIAQQEGPQTRGHAFGFVPIVEYWNNPQEKGDFEGVISLIDAYDMLQADRVNDKQQFVDALLVLYGVAAGIAPATDPNDKRTPGQRIRDEKLLLLPPTAKAEYLAKQLNEADVEVLKKAINSDIHKFSQVPDLTDEHFAGDASGVAMRYKLLGLEQLTKVKERWFREGLRWRLRLFSNYMKAAGDIDQAFDPEGVTLTFTRSLPVNEPEIAQMIRDLQGTVPDELLLPLLPFVSDVEAALAMLEEQKAKAAELQAKTFGGGYVDANKTPPGAGGADDDQSTGEE